MRRARKSAAVLVVAVSATLALAGCTAGQPGAAAARRTAGSQAAKRAAGAPGAASTTPAGSSSTPRKRPAPPPLRITSITPARAGTGPGETRIVVRFSARLDPTSPHPNLSPATAGTWSLTGHAAVFEVTGAFLPDSTVKLTVPGGRRGVRSATGARLARSHTAAFRTGAGSILRAQQLLASLGYSPLNWTPTGAAIPATDLAAQQRAVYAPPPGKFTWRSTGWPASLIRLWQPGVDTTLTRGVVMAFEADHGLAVDGVIGPQVWGALLAAVANHQTNTSGYTYAVTSKASPETLTVWHNGRVVLHTLANTGIAAAPTADGTFPVYERLRDQVMKGTEPDGRHYADPVQYVAYFDGGDAVHYLWRASYGWPQSLGCVELPLRQAATAWSYLAIGTLVTVTG